MGEYVFIFIVFFCLFFFIRIYIISRKAENYIKKTYHEYWLENIRFGGFSGPYGGSTIFQLAKNIKDPIIQIYEKQWLRAIKYFIIALLLSIVVSVLCIYFFEI